MGTENDDHLRADDGNLAQQKRFADDRFIRIRHSISRRPAAIDIADKNIASFETDRTDNVRQELSGAAYKRLAEAVFVSPRSFANEHQIRIEIADAVDD